MSEFFVLSIFFFVALGQFFVSVTNFLMAKRLDVLRASIVKLSLGQGEISTKNSRESNGLNRASIGSESTNGDSEGVHKCI